MKTTATSGSLYSPGSLTELWLDGHRNLSPHNPPVAMEESGVSVPRDSALEAPSAGSGGYVVFSVKAGTDGGHPKVNLSGDESK